MEEKGKGQTICLKGFEKYDAGFTECLKHTYRLKGLFLKAAALFAPNDLV